MARRRPTEGLIEDDQLQQMCNNAKRVLRLCEIFGFSPDELDNESIPRFTAVHGRHPHHLHQVVSEDPDDRPFIWELDNP